MSCLCRDTCWDVMCGIFFFQAEDGIRDADVTGVQTCALPIYLSASARPERLVKHRLEIGRHAHVSTAISARSWAINAAIASPGVQTRNVIVSPGHSWPATLMSAVITVASFG